ncbi:citrate lyase holo-[acyl-carrier protein] synthase [Clostridium fallax]|uniref:citrate lyase holo-[acyl-carrier protein] synthase n=1 Tax=Clostridium fallax TaxID=1533 RepID=A0A1M4TTG9_9CLOT|nr:citrate lyase holo-[acyl-carrier protein] synthase [Clostridium fallax]SHE47695.1 holo-ACP synthase [Clostridium fallax]SQB22407.1 citX protein [Clostridium fallax]
MSDILDFLLEREKRVEWINNLKGEYQSPCVFIRANYPGINKCNNVTKGIVNEIIKELHKHFPEDKIMFSKKGESKEGPYGIFVINDRGENIKRATIKIEENHFLGRLVDIDVYDIDKVESISRKDLNKEARKCYLCDKSAHICSRNRSHPIEDIETYIEDRWRTFNEKYIKNR